MPVAFSSTSVATSVTVPLNQPSLKSLRTPAPRKAASAVCCDGSSAEGAILGGVAAALRPAAAGAAWLGRGGRRPRLGRAGKLGGPSA